MRQNYGCGVAPQRSSDHFARMHFRSIDGAVKQFHVLDKPMSGIEVSGCKHLSLQPT
jgi:hypothetical protein